MTYSSFLKRKGPRTSMSIDLFILILISCHVFYLKPLDPVFGGNGTFTFFMLMLAYLYIRYLGFSVRFGIVKHLTPMFLFAAGIVLSFVPAYIFYGQHIYYSLVAYRHALYLLVYPIILSIQPSREEIKRALYAFSFFFLFVSVYVTFITPHWVVVSEGSSLIDEGDFFHVFSGPHYVLLAMLFAVDDFLRLKSVRSAFIAGFFFLILFLVQNRTLLMGSMVVIVFASLFNKSARTRLYAEVLLLIIGAAVAVLGNEYFVGLWNETMFELNNPEYNRVKAFLYFTSLENGPLALFLGNGFISGHVDSIMQDLMMEGIFNADLGLIGLWHQYGLIPVVTVLVYEFKGMSRHHSFLVRGNAVFMLTCTLTIAYFVDCEFVLWLSLYWYLLSTDKTFEESMIRERQITERKIIRRYRSIAR